MDRKRYYTVDEANALIPALESSFATLMQLRTQLRAAAGELEGMGESLEERALLSTAGRPEVVSARGRFRALIEAFGDAIAAVEEHEIEIKDLDIGLCDFLGRREGREVWLCWRYGEKTVGFFHELDAGFSGRQPLDEPPPPSARILH